MKKVLFVLIVAVFLSSCTKDNSAKGSYVAKIDSVKITWEDVRAEMDALPPMAKEFFQGPEGAARFVDEIVKKELLYLETKKRGLDKDKDFKRKVEEFKKITLINQILEKEIEAAGKDISDKEIRDYYEQNKDEFTVNTKVRLSHIVLKTDDEAKKAYERLQEGADFAKLAMELSTDKSSAKAGGDLGFFSRGEMTPELEEAAFSLRKGETSRPVKLKSGIHILKVTDAKGNVVEFDKVKDILGQRMAAERQRESFDKFIESLKKSYKIEINKEAVSKLDFGAPQQNKDK